MPFSRTSENLHKLHSKNLRPDLQPLLSNNIYFVIDGKTEMFTDEKGYACSIPLPYGTYIVRETTTPHNYKPVEDFEITIRENNPDKP